MKLRNVNSPEEIIEILQFNYDGEGSCLYVYNETSKIYEMSLKDLRNGLFGENGNPTYHLL